MFIFRFLTGQIYLQHKGLLALKSCLINKELLELNLLGFLYKEFHKKIFLIHLKKNQFYNNIFNWCWI